MPENPHGHVTGLTAFTDADAALARITEIYAAGTAAIRARFAEFPGGGGEPAAAPACYPYVGIVIGPDQVNLSGALAYGKLQGPGAYGTTLTRPDLFRGYYREQLDLLLRNHGQPVWVGTSNRPIPLTFVIEEATADITTDHVQALRSRFPLPDLSRIDDAVANGTYLPVPGEPRPLALFSAERVDLSLVRLAHYTGTSPRHFQRFVLFTNYQRYVDEFIAYGRDQVTNGEDYDAFVEPGDVATPNPRVPDAPAGGSAPEHLPQMPAYHLLRDDHEGITLINIGIGPSNAKTITDHLAVLRPHCWLMVGHCGGLRLTQRLGDYVLAHAYLRGDHVLDEDLPMPVPVPPIAEVQIALTEAVARVTGLEGRELKVRLRTGTVFTTDDRDWELRYDELAKRFNQSRAIAVDMESATIAANGFRLRVPYGTLLCVSDKPLHGEIKLPGMANTFYRERISQHLRIGIAALASLRDAGVETLHSRKLRSFDEPAFR
jgi:AMP nucleosidase